MTRRRLTEQSENEICLYKDNAIVTSLAYLNKLPSVLLYRNEAKLKLLVARVYILYEIKQNISR